MDYSEIKKEYVERAARIMDGHEYTLLTSGNGCEVWRCGKPGTNVYAFNICVAPMGISVVGDIGNLTFCVHGRGVGFLAGKDVEYYIHSKLSERCKETEYDEEGTKELVVQNAVYAIEDELRALPEEQYNYVEPTFNCEKPPSFEELKEYVVDMVIETNGDLFTFFDKLNDFLEEIDNCSYIEEANNMLYNCDLIQFDEFWHATQKTCGGLIRKLYMINHAAKEIMNIKDAQPDDIGVEDGRDG